MSKAVGSQTSFIGGISYSEKEGAANTYSFGSAIDHRTDPTSVTLNPRSEKDSGSLVQDLPLWGARACDRTFFYDLSGNIYQDDSGTKTLVHTAADSSGNGLSYFTQDRALYYAQDTTFGRLPDACTDATFYDDFKASEGGAPTNTKSIDFEASSSMYASRADTASLSITGDLTLEAYIKPESLPTTGNTMTLMSKWDENGDIRSYKMDLTTVSNFFGDGSDGALTIAASATEAPIDSACAGTAAAYALTATNASFAADQQIMIHQTRGTNAGVVQYTSIQSYTAGTITTTDPLDISYSSTGANKAQVRVLKQYTNVTINSGKTYTAKAWNGTVGGILAFYANGTVTVTGTITATGKGFRGGSANPGANLNGVGVQGESGTGAGSRNYIANGSGGGGGTFESVCTGATQYSGTCGPGGDKKGGGAGGGYGTAGVNGVASVANPSHSPGGLGGTISGSANLTSVLFGGGGGQGGIWYTHTGSGGNGGGITCIFGKTIAEVTGTITCSGSSGSNAGSGIGAGGGGAGGSILFKAQTATFGTVLITASGGSGGTTDDSTREEGSGGAGGVGRIHLDYSSSYTGTTTPAITVAIDSTLASTDGYALRLQISDDGTAVESYTQEITEIIDTTSWARWQISWEDTTSTANFYKNSVLLGTKTGSMTAIDDNASVFTVAADFDTTAQNFYDGLMDDARVWNDVRTITELATNNDQVLYGTETSLVAYYEFESGVTDSQTDGLNDLTAANTPTYSDDVPFSGVTTRADQDQLNNQTGQTYTLATSISEGATHRQTFVPDKDPQKSIELDINDAGSGNWTLTVHDALNREVAAVTVAVAQLHTGVYEFIFASVWRPIIGASYHFHVTSTVADGVVVTGTTVDLETARYWSHYQFLVSDAYHPMEQFLDFLVVGNERYVAKFEAGDSFEPHQLTFSSGWRVRCLGFWREFIAIGCWKGTNITDFDQGRIFFWDGVSDTFNHSIPVPEGGVNAMFGTQDVLFIVAGYSGEILIYTGGGAAQKYNKIPKLAKDEYLEVAPGSINMWRSNIHFGVGLNTDSESVHKGVYTIGTSQRQYATSLGFDYPTSLGEQTGSNVKIGLVYPSGQDLYIGWRNSNAYGIDKISVDNDVYSSGSLELLIREITSISKQGYPLILRADFEELASGESIRLKYKGDRETTWNYSDYEDTVGATNTRLRIPKRMREIQVGCDFATTVSTSPKLTGLTIEAELEERSAKRA